MLVNSDSDIISNSAQRESDTKTARIERQGSNSTMECSPSPVAGQQVPMAGQQRQKKLLRWLPQVSVILIPSRRSCAIQARRGCGMAIATTSFKEEAGDGCGTASWSTR